MRKLFSLLMVFFLSGCLTQNFVEAVPSATFTPTLRPTYTATVTETPTMVPTSTLTPTATSFPRIYNDGRLNCPGSVAFMYHQIYPTPEHNTGFLEINNDIGSFEKVVQYLVKNDFYFPTPGEFATDVNTGLCRHKYAIIIIDDSWDDPEGMGVTDVLVRAGGGTGIEGSPKVWFAVITRMMVYFVNSDGQKIEPWEHMRDMQERELVYIVSHTQTHPLPIDRNNPKANVNNKIYRRIGNELLPSRKDILRNMNSEPYFFVYPGGYIADPIISGLRPAGYLGAFTVWAGSLDGALPYYLPRINGGLRCGTTGVDNSDCVIEQIKKYSK